MKKILVTFLFCWFICLPSIAQTDKSPSQNVTLQQNTQIPLQIDNAISSHDATVGEIVHFHTVGDCSVNGIIVIPNGTPAEGIVTVAKPKGHLGHAGKLDIDVKSVTLSDGTIIPLSGSQVAEGEGHGTRTAVATGVTAAVFLPAAPFLLLMHGADVTIPAGTVTNVFVAQPVAIHVSNK